MYPLLNSTEQEALDRIESVLVVRFSSIGDIILTTPVLRAIKARWPEARITFVTKSEFACLLEGNPHVDEPALLPPGGGARDLHELAGRLAQQRWDLLADLHNSLRSRILRRIVPAGLKRVYRKPLVRRSLLIYTRLDLFGKNILQVPERYAASLEDLGVELDDCPCELYPSGRDHELVESRIAGHWGSIQPYLAVAPGAAWPVKRWLPERFAAAAKEIAESHGLKIVLVGAEKEREACDLVGWLGGGERCLNLAGELSITASAAAVKSARLLLSNDSGLMHAATAVGTPVVAVFGPTTGHFGYFPYKAASRVVQTDLFCRPCTHNGRGRCPLFHFRCMRDIPAQRVIEAAGELLEESVKPL